MLPLRTIRRLLSCVALVFCSLPSGASAQAHFAAAIGPGSFYEIDVPAGWNGDLLSAPGIVPESLPVAPPSGQEGFPVVRAQLLAGGFAVAASSYSSNGWALDDAVRRTHQLGGIVAAKVRQPRRTFLVGHSLGRARDRQARGATPGTVRRRAGRWVAQSRNSSTRATRA